MRRQRARGAGRVACLAMAALIAACSDAKVTAPSDANLSVIASSAALSFSATATITAQVVGGNGSPVDGVPVVFATTLGTLNPAEAVTKGGVATTTFDAGPVSGTARITAVAGGHSGTVMVAVGVAAVARVAVVATPAAVAFGGGLSAITATVTDGMGNPLVTIPVAFQTTAGTLAPNIVKTDAKGVGSTVLTTTSQAVVTASIIASAADGGGGSSVLGTTTVAIAPQPKPVVGVMVSPNPVALVATTFTLSVMPAPGTITTIQSVSIDFGDGTAANLGAVSGAAIPVQHVYVTGGPYTATITATDSGGGTTIFPVLVAVGPSAPVSVTITAGAPVPLNCQSLVTLTAAVAPPTVVVASYQWDFGDNRPRETTTGPQVQHPFRWNSTDPYRVTVTVKRADGGPDASGFVFVSVPAPPGSALCASAP
jgi:hypothetical protein